jgi:hypothetical protein
MLELILFLLFRKDEDKMAIIYATLIIKGKKTIHDVPDRIKEQVKEILIDLDCGYLAEEA